MLSTLKKFTARHSLAFSFALFLAWQAPCWFPFTPFEGDAISVALGCEQTYSEGWQTLGDYGYGYWMQPLTYIILLALKCLFPAVTAITTYTILTLATVVTLQWFMARLCITLTRCKPWVPFLAMFLFPETYALGTFPNATALALCCATGAMYGIVLGKRTLPYALFLIAPLLRLDIVQIYPVVPLLLYYNRPDLKKTILHTSALALATLAIIIFGFKALNASPLHTLDVYHEWGDNRVTYLHTLNALYGCFGMAAPVFALMGVGLLKRRKETLLLCIILVPTIIVLYVNRNFGNAAKHFCLAMPLIIPAIATALQWCVANRRKTMVRVAIIITAPYLTLGLRITNKSQNLLADYGPGVKICQFTIGAQHMEIVLGIGTPMTTADEVTLLSGNLYYPVTIHNIKVNQQLMLDHIDDVLRQAPAQAQFLYIDSWENDQLVSLLQFQGRTHGHTPQPEHDLFIMQSRDETPEHYDIMTQALLQRHATTLQNMRIITLSAINHRDWTLHQALRQRLGPEATP